VVDGGETSRQRAADQRAADALPRGSSEVGPRARATRATSAFALTAAARCPRLRLLVSMRLGTEARQRRQTGALLLSCGRATVADLRRRTPAQDELRASAGATGRPSRSCIREKARATRSQLVSMQWSSRTRLERQVSRASYRDARKWSGTRASHRPSIRSPGHWDFKTPREVPNAQATTRDYHVERGKPPWPHAARRWRTLAAGEGARTSPSPDTSRRRLGRPRCAARFAVRRTSRSRRACPTASCT
jgi:hypothetical protein